MRGSRLSPIALVVQTEDSNLQCFGAFFHPVRTKEEATAAEEKDKVLTLLVSLSICHP